MEDIWTKRPGQTKAAAPILLLAACALWIAAGGSRGSWRYDFQNQILAGAEEMYMPGLAFLNRAQDKGAREWVREKALAWLPLVSYAEDHAVSSPAIEDEETLAKILDAQANDENAVDENGNLVGEPEPAEAAAQPAAPTVDMSIEKLRDFDYLLSNFYTVDSSTMIGPEQLNADDLLSRSMKIDNTTGGPKVIIFHTHSQEEFVDSTPGDPATSIVGMGDYLTELLNEKGIETIHDTGVYDIINGQLDRSNAYENAEASVRPLIEANPTLEVAIDLHRDGVAEGTHLVTEINGKPTAKIMYFNGLSRTRTNGDIDYLYNPYIQDNLAFSLQMQLASESLYPGFVRHIYLRAYRYNLHLLPKSLLVEAGAQTNTVAEMRNAMEVLADTLAHVILE
ncbi:MAG TPA: stage II sporulation protein P [Candidatus Mediterraneibacter caccavium]|uniref:Stage II sporulation protein P n=1 Tax=Candidatus Mediterraneibacter caccavium TaxID=2838661 RepID=A0A9D2ASI4_9FIRM|nr:stage II sporulation protein P [Lachnoclostridium sp. An76]OUN35842.1 stage II sporulation protein P [Lachnoclostridium sp. An76]HIX48308.1 stage II sporulation protein P [Candidatus Mediterraneibacter caccavium]